MSYLRGVVFLVADLEKTVVFFKNLGFEEIWRTEEPGNIFETLYQFSGCKTALVHLCLKDADLYILHLTAGHIKPYPSTVSGNDLAFQHIALVVSDMDRAHKLLIHQGIEHISSKPQTLPEWNEPAAGIRAFYFRAPNGYPMELIFYPPGKGDPRWQSAQEDLFLGIDHTAITVFDTARSVKFYCEILGLKIIGGSLNYGQTQEALSGVPTARVKITALHSPTQKGIGLEFLEYLEPKLSQSSLEKIAKHEQARLHIVLEVEDFTRIQDQLRLFNIVLLSEGRVHIDKKMHQGVVVEDPDGHRILIIEKGESVCQ